MLVTLQTDARMAREQSLVLWLDDVSIADVPLVGGKNASLGEMIQQLGAKGIRVPGGFATTAFAYRCFMECAGLDQRLHQLFADLDVEDMANLHWHGAQARSLILSTPFPEPLQRAIATAYDQLVQRYSSHISVAVRSSATAEDLPDASFAGQQDTYLNMHGLEQVLSACQRCFASLFTDRAISYRTLKGYDHFDVALSVGIQLMVRSDLATSGVMFSIDTESGFANAVLITAAYGLGETVVQGAVNPDEYRVFKPTLTEGFRPILSKRLGSKAIKLVYGGAMGHTTTVEVAQTERDRFALTDDEVLQLAQWACQIEHHYSRVRGVATPMDMEWAKDGVTGELFIVQARPETVQSQKTHNTLRHYSLLPLPDSLRPVTTGRAVGDMIGQGQARVILTVADIGLFQPGEVLVTSRTDPDWEPIMKKASAIVTDQGGRTCHAAIIAREMGIPAIVGCGNATTVLQLGQDVTVSCAEGEEGRVYPGLLPFTVTETPLGDVPRSRTQVLMNVGNPDEAFRLAAIPNDGVGLARMEFIIANQIRVHPLALLHFDELADESVKEAIAQLARHNSYKPDYFVDRLSQGIATIAAAFYPKPVIVRMSDFKSNEYANLLGGAAFEPNEENPMIGWRGAARYYDERYRAAFGLECKALRQVREDMGLTNVIPMIPFCRTPEEGRKVLAEMALHGLERGKQGLQVYVMCEVPSNVILANEFADVFDGFSIGSNDLTQLTLGLDRDSSLVAHLFDERNAAVKTMIQWMIQKAKAKGRKIGICGQAPSDYPEFAQFLVSLGIDSISLNPDTVLKGRLDIVQAEAAAVEPKL
ncbi:phosphoenolpyruvate synthase [Leptolyngbya sp. AN02str]|uniref:phosphoenolpyruvate synthase n=1 Tax=Leptolyngbya sp. AN02str TaxID=3423363 RepID=UPI003D3238F3